MHPRPKIVISKCLGFDSCRYDGSILKDSFAFALRKHVDFIPVCPEVSIGLGTPRDTIRLVKEKDGNHLYQPATKKDVTTKMHSFSKKFIKDLDSVDGFILKHSSPTCAPGRTKVYHSYEPSSGYGSGKGMFAQYIVDHFSHLAIEDEGRLTNLRLREHFLTRIFMCARFRELRGGGNLKDLITFHTDNKHLYLAYNQTRMRIMGRILANQDGNFKKTVAAYGEEFYATFAKPPRYMAMVNVAQHLYSGFKQHINAKEKAHFTKLVREYEEERIPFTILSELLYSWGLRFNQEYVLNQRLFDPFPKELIDLADSGRRTTYTGQSP